MTPKSRSFRTSLHVHRLGRVRAEPPAYPSLRWRRLCGLPGPAIAVIAGMRKPWKTAFTEVDYARVRDMGSAYRASLPRRIVV